MSMTTTIYAVRHGESTFNKEHRWQGRAPEPPLTELGQLQAEAAGKLLSKSGVQFDAVITSHLVRASETGSIIGKQLGINQVEHIEDLQERDVGCLTKSYVLFLANQCTGRNLYRDAIFRYSEAEHPFQK